MQFTNILYDKRDGTAIVTLNRPDRLNAWTPAMANELQQAMETARDDADVRSIILTGAGRGFCAGADMAVLSGLSASGSRAEPDFTPPDRNSRADFQQPMSWLPAIDKPIIAAINGPVAGMGLAFVLFADLRFAAESAKFVTAFSRRGLIAEHGIGWMLPRLVGHSRALDLLLSSRPVLAEEALHIGLIDRVAADAELLDTALAYARDINENVSPRSTRIIKRQLWDALFVDLATSLKDADHEMALSLGCADFREGVAHFLEKRPARFTGR